MRYFLFHTGGLHFLLSSAFAVVQGRAPAQTSVERNQGQLLVHVSRHPLSDRHSHAGNFSAAHEHPDTVDLSADQLPLPVLFESGLVLDHLEVHASLHCAFPCPKQLCLPVSADRVGA